MFTLPKLPYSFDALEPHIDALTMEIHHTKHHQGYVDKLNTALEKYPDLQSRSINELLLDFSSIPEEIRSAVQNNGGGHANHSLFWSIMTKPGENQPTGTILTAIDKAFSNFESFQEQFTTTASTRFGSGWAWLTVEKGDLHICSTPNQDTPLMDGNTPILGLDVWEHAYYLNYQNRRPDYISAFFNLINWNKVEEYYQEAIN